MCAHPLQLTDRNAIVVDGKSVSVPSQSHGYPYVSETVVVHPWVGSGWMMTVSTGDSAGGWPRLSGSRRSRIGFTARASPSVLDGGVGDAGACASPVRDPALASDVPDGAMGEEDAHARTVERRRKSRSRAMVGA